MLSRRRPRPSIRCSRRSNSHERAMTLSRSALPANGLKPFAGRRALFSLGRYSFVLPAVIFLIVFMFYPLLYTFNLSLFDVNAGNFIKGGAAFVGLENYFQFIASPTFLPSLGITVV